MCKICWELNKRDKDLHHLQCLQSSHEHTEFIPVAWDKLKRQLIKIRPQPDFIVGQKYSMCSSDECPGESCIDAHSTFELKAWNFEWHKQKRPVTIIGIHNIKCFYYHSHYYRVCILYTTSLLIILVKTQTFLQSIGNQFLLRD